MLPRTNLARPSGHHRHRVGRTKIVAAARSGALRTGPNEPYLRRSFGRRQKGARATFSDYRHGAHQARNTASGLGIAFAFRADRSATNTQGHGASLREVPGEVRSSANSVRWAFDTARPTPSSFFLWACSATCSGGRVGNGMLLSRHIQAAGRPFEPSPHISRPRSPFRGRRSRHAEAALIRGCPRVVMGRTTTAGLIGRWRRCTSARARKSNPGSRPKCSVATGASRHMRWRRQKNGQASSRRRWT